MLRLSVAPTELLFFFIIYPGSDDPGNRLSSLRDLNEEFTNYEGIAIGFSLMFECA